MFRGVVQRDLLDPSSRVVAPYGGSMRAGAVETPMRSCDDGWARLTPAERVDRTALAVQYASHRGDDPPEDAAQ